MLPSLSRSLSHCPESLPHPHRRHCDCHHQDTDINHSALRDPPSSHIHYPHRLYHPNSVERPGGHLACTGGGLVAQSLPRDYRYLTRRNAWRGVQPSPSRLSADRSDQLDPQRDGGCPIPKCLFGRGFCPTFAPYMTGRMPTTPEKVNTCIRGLATSAGIVKCGELWLDQERLYHKRDPIPSHLWRHRHFISIWVHRGVLGCIHSDGPDPMTGVNIQPMSAFLLQQFSSPFLCPRPLEPSLWVENESTSEVLALWYSCMKRKEAQRERTK